MGRAVGVSVEFKKAARRMHCLKSACHSPFVSFPDIGEVVAILKEVERMRAQRMWSPGSMPLR